MTTDIQRTATLRIGDWDEHPNPAGNQLIADRLLELMYQHRSEFHLGPGLTAGYVRALSPAK